MSLKTGSTCPCARSRDTSSPSVGVPIMASPRGRVPRALLQVLVLPALVAVDERRPWRPGESVCPTLPNFETADLFPIRSPLIVADYLSVAARGRSFCEIGTRNGDVMGCVSRFARSVTAIEMDEGYCAKLRARGFGVACQRIEDIPIEDFPTADVYYWWPSDAGGQNELVRPQPPPSTSLHLSLHLSRPRRPLSGCIATRASAWVGSRPLSLSRARAQWLRIVARALRHKAARATVYVGFDVHWQPDMGVLPNLLRKYNGTVERLYFDEGGAISGRAVESPIYNAAHNKLEASLAHPFFARPGHWGVFLVARFDIGPEMWRRMRNLPFAHPEFRPRRKSAWRGGGGGGFGGGRVAT